MAELLEEAGLFEATEARIVMLVSICAALVAVGVYVVARVRRSVSVDMPKGYDWLTNFRELHSQGELSDEEYRNIKTTLTSRAGRQLKGKAEEG